MRSPPTPRERDVLALLCLGEANKVIASRLGISSQAVKSHVSSLFVKYRVQNRAGLVAATIGDRQSGQETALREAIARSHALMDRQTELIRETHRRVGRPPPAASPEEEPQRAS